MSRKTNIEGVKITQAREARGKDWTQIRLAQEMSKAGADVSRDQIANWEYGRTRSMLMSTLQVMSAVLEKPASYFTGKHTPPEPEEEKGRIPVVGAVSAERFNFSFDNPPETYLPVKLDLPGDRRAVALRISGECMVNPQDPRGSLYPGDYVIIVEQHECVNGTIAVVRIDGEHTLKRIYKTKDGYELRPDNPKYDTIYIKGDIDVVGIKLAKYSP